MDRRSTEVSQDSGTGWWQLWGAAALGGLLLVVGPFLIGAGQDAATAEKPDTSVGYWMVCGAVAILGGIAVTAVNQVLAYRREKKRSVGLTGYNDALSDLHKAVEDLLRSDRDPTNRAVFFNAVVRSAGSLLPQESVRVCVYELDSNEGDDRSAEPSTYLRLVDYGGRSDPPRKEFVPSTPHGAAAIHVAQGRTPVCVHDWENTGHRIQREPGSAWEAFIAVPLHSGSESLGLLSFDTRAKTTFTEEHAAIARTAAFLVALGMTELVDGAVVTADEVREVRSALADHASIPGTSEASSIVGDGVRERDD